MEKCSFTATGTICETPGMYAAEGRTVRSMRLQIKTIEGLHCFPNDGKQTHGLKEI